MSKQQIDAARAILNAPKKPDEQLLAQFQARAERDIRTFAAQQERRREEAERHLLQVRFRAGSGVRVGNAP